MGVITTRALGAALITAVCVAAADIVQVDVRAGTTSVPQGLIFEDGFESGNRNSAANGVEWLVGVGAISTDRAFSGSHSMRLNHRASPDCQQSSSEQRFALPPVREVWIEYAFYVPGNFHHRKQDGVYATSTGRIEAGESVVRSAAPIFSRADRNSRKVTVKGAGAGGADLTGVIDTVIDSYTVSLKSGTSPATASTSVFGTELAVRCTSNATNNKFLRVWGNRYGDGDPQWGASFNALDDGSSRLYLQRGDTHQVMLSTQVPDSYFWEPTFTPEQRGKWMVIGWHGKLSSVQGVADGVVELWVDGARVATSGPIEFWSELPENYFDMGYLMGAANSGYEEETTFYVDDFRVYTSDPDW